MATKLYRSSVALIVRRDGKYLAVNNRKWGKFSWPGGKAEDGETLEESARRELLEETGCNAVSLRRVAAMVHDSVPKDADKTPWICMAFEVGIGDQEPRANEEGTRPFWATAEELLEGGLYPDWYSWYFRTFPDPDLRDRAVQVAQDFLHNRDNVNLSEAEELASLVCRMFGEEVEVVDDDQESLF